MAGDEAAMALETEYLAALQRFEQLTDPAQLKSSYLQTLEYESGAYQFVFPMVVAPRYIPGQALPCPSVGDGTASDTDAVPDASRITPPVEHPSRGPLNPVSLAVELDPGTPLARLTAS